MEIPLVLISNGVLLPGASLKIPIKSRNNVTTVEKHLANRIGAQNYVAIAYKISADKVYEVCTVAYVDKIFGFTFNNLVQYSIHVVGLYRATIDKLTLPTCRCTQISDGRVQLEHVAVEKLVGNAKLVTAKVDEMLAQEIHDAIDARDYSRVADLCVSQLKHIGYAQLLEYLGCNDVEKRIAMFEQWMRSYAEKSIVLHTNDTKLSAPIGQAKRKMIPNAKNSVEQLEEKISAIEFPENVQERVNMEVQRLKGLSSSQTEYNVLLGWLELVAALPWSTATTDEIDMKQARAHLEQSHDAMDEVKVRVLEHLAVCKMTSVRGAILCLTGPPGIGKTSIAKAIAQSMGRKFERISLGGIRDESDIRGHRRTYVAAMPGRVIEALKHCKTKNPIILLDEVDKLYAGNQGSPSAALLELLDPEQNHTFHDHYLNLPFDASEIMFIATANDVSNIEPALRDRLEIIEMSGYSLKEKLNICEHHLIPRQLAKHCISPDYVSLDRHTISTVIEEYTMEAGVRQLERNVAAICRHVALRLADALNTDPGADVLPDVELPISIRVDDAHRILRTKHMKRMRIVEKMRPLSAGVCFGLSVTLNGGRVLPIEASKSVGTGKITKTGHLGKVLEESILVAKAWLAANSARLNISDLSHQDVHVHLPSGSINKDGPSAGCGLVCALVSLAMDQPLRSDTAITGEISLSGHVFPIGGVKEKVLAAQREGLRRVVLPKSNEEEYEKLDTDVKNEMEIVLVDTIDEVISAMMNGCTVLAKL